MTDPKPTCAISLLSKLRVLAGYILCLLAVALFAVNLPNRINFIGPLLLITGGVWLIVGPSKILKDQKRRKQEFQEYVARTPSAKESYIASKKLSHLGFVLIVVSLLWMYVSPGLFANGGWLLSYGLGGLVALGGVVLVSYSSFSSGAQQLNAFADDDTKSDNS